MAVVGHAVVERLRTVGNADVVRAERKRVVALMDHAQALDLGEYRIVIRRRGIDVAARAHHLLVSALGRKSVNLSIQG